MVVTVGVMIGYSFVFPDRYRAEIESAAARYGVDENLISGVIWAESKFDPNAVSAAGAMGLMQIKPSTGAYIAAALKVPYSDERLFDPAYNIELGAYYLSYLFKRFNTEADVLAAYNAGEGRVRQWLTDEVGYQYQETSDYVRRVLFAKRIFVQKSYYHVRHNNKHGAFVSIK